MKRIAFPLLLIAAIVTGCQIQPEEQGEITVDLSLKGADVPVSMYGVFFEEINHAGDGGLYAELVQNRSFEEKEPPAGYTTEGNRLRPAPVRSHLSGEVSDQTYRWSSEEFPGWSVRSTGGAKAQMALTKDQPLHPATPNSLRVTIPANAGEVSLVNSGYWGMGLFQGEKYMLRCYLRTPGYSGTVTARLTDGSGNAVAVELLTLIPGKEWNEYKITLTPGQTVTDGRLELVFTGSGTFWADYISLFPEQTFLNRPNGLRRDVAQFLADLKPAFIRWPGGCIVEGITLSNRVQWKKTLGDPMTRSGEYDTWGYRNTY